MKRKFVHAYNYEPSARGSEHPKGISCTIPAQANDIRSFLDRPQSVMFGRSEGYSADDYPDLHQMERIDVMTMRLNNAKALEVLLEEQHVLAKELERRKDEELLAARKAANDRIIADQKAADAALP